MTRRVLVSLPCALVLVLGGCDRNVETPDPGAHTSSAILSGAARDWQLLSEKTRAGYCRAYEAGTITSVEDLGFQSTDADEQFFDEYMALLEADC